MRIPVGMIHGRFQPFHVGHFDYLKRALALTADELVVGVTNPFPDLVVREPTDGHRHLGASNPFTYFERHRMIQLSIAESPELRSALPRITIVPFPIHHPEHWPHFVPDAVTQIMSVFEDWDREKARRFLAYGFGVHELDCSRLTSGTEVRRCLEEGRDVDALVPEGTRRVLRGWARARGRTS